MFQLCSFYLNVSEYQSRQEKAVERVHSCPLTPAAAEGVHIARAAVAFSTASHDSVEYETRRV